MPALCRHGTVDAVQALEESTPLRMSPMFPPTVFWTRRDSTCPGNTDARPAVVPVGCQSDPHLIGEINEKALGTTRFFWFVVDARLRGAGGRTLVDEGRTRLWRADLALRPRARVGRGAEDRRPRDCAAGR